jgi:YesN/AraC family two-component response regulator
MPHITGLELARNLKQINKEVRVILCSGFSQTLTADQAEAAGIKEVVMKPLVHSQLATAIRRSLQG